MNSVFSCAAGAASSSSAGAEAAGPAAAKPPMGMSGMLRRVCGEEGVNSQLLGAKMEEGLAQICQKLALRFDTRSAVSSSVN